MKKSTLSILSLLIILLIIPSILANDLTQKDIQLTINLNSPVYVNITYSNLFKLTNLGHVSGQTDSIFTTTHYNLSLNNSLLHNSTFTKTINSHSASNTGEVIFQNYGTYLLCGEITNSSYPDNHTDNTKACAEFILKPIELICNVSINISTEKNIYDNKEPISFFNLINNQTIPFTIEYWVEDLFENILKSKTNTTNLNQKSYTPSIDETDKTIIIKNRLIIQGCNNSGDEFAQKTLTIKNNITINKNSSIILQKYSDELSFGDSFNIEFSAYRGDTLKRTIYFWIEDSKGKEVSEKYKVSLNQKYTLYEFNLPLQTNPNCEDSYDSGKHYLIISGLNITLSEPIFLSGKNTKLCKTEYITEEVKVKEYSPSNPTSTNKLSSFQYSIFHLPSPLYTNKSFNISINLTNPNNSPYNISLWAYLYIGSKQYSFSRDHNKMSFILKSYESKLINLTITNLAEINKTYKLKVKINKNNQKTNYELTEDIYLTNLYINTTIKRNGLLNNPLTSTNLTNSLIHPSHIQESINNKSLNLLPTGMLLLNPLNSSTVYESKQKNILSHAIYILIILLLLAIMLFYKFYKKD